MALGAESPGGSGSSDAAARIVVITMPTENNPPLKPLKWYRKLAARKGRLEAGAFVVEGERTGQRTV